MDPTDGLKGEMKRVRIQSYTKQMFRFFTASVIFKNFFEDPDPLSPDSTAKAENPDPVSTDPIVNVEDPNLAKN